MDMLDKIFFEYLFAPKITVLLDKPSEEFSQRIEKHKNQIAEVWDLERNKKNLTNGNVLNLHKIVRADKQLILYCHTIEYKYFLAQRAGHSLGITPLGVSGLVFYEENGVEFLFVGRRSELVTQYPGYFELIPSGSIDVSNVSSKEELPYSEQIIKELKEELGLKPDKIKKLNTLGLIFDSADQTYDIGIIVEVENSPIKLNVQEYAEVHRVCVRDFSLSRMNLVKTSKILFEAWIYERESK